MWLLFWQPRKTVVDARVKAVKSEIDGDPKAGFTLIGSRAAYGDVFCYSLLQREEHTDFTSNSALDSPESFHTPRAVG
jgi:hypothetical protein